MSKKLFLDDYIERTPRPEPNIGEENVTLRLSGVYLERFRQFTKISGVSSKSEIMREALSLLFACSAEDGEGNPVEIILRRKNFYGTPHPEVPLLDFLELPILNTYLKNKKDKKKACKMAHKRLIGVFFLLHSLWCFYSK